MVNTALAYAELGWPVFRVRPNSKKPYDRWRNGPTYATTLPAEIKSRWHEMPDANIGIETGRQAASYGHLAVLDVDRYEGMTPELEKLAKGTRSVTTPSGGLHYYFYTDRAVKNSVSALGDGIDVRGAGGMVLAPPSVGATGDRYCLFNDVPIKVVRAERLEPVHKTITSGSVRNEAFLRSTAPDGGRNNYIASACGSWLHDWDGTTDVLDALDEYAQRVNLEDCQPPLSGYEVSRTAISMYTRHLKGIRNGR